MGGGGLVDCLILTPPAPHTMQASKSILETMMKHILMLKLALACAALLRSIQPRMWAPTHQPPLTLRTRLRNSPKFRPSPQPRNWTWWNLNWSPNWLLNKSTLHSSLPNYISSSQIRFPCEFLQSWETAEKFWRICFLEPHHVYIIFLWGNLRMSLQPTLIER